MSNITISSQFDAGAIDIVSLENPNDIQLNIRGDNAAEFAQWFYFRLQGGSGQALTLRIMNAGNAAYPQGWKDYGVVASYDRQDWFRLSSHYDGETLSFNVTPDANDMWFAYFEPYSYERHLDLIGFANTSDSVETLHLGCTLDGRDMTLLKITAPDEAAALASRKIVWLIARQHPGESMAEWFAEGFIERLLDKDDSVSQVLLQNCVFYVVPHMNPDGAVRGNLRTNAAGANLNREWEVPTMARSPEVFLVRQKMFETGVDLFLDAHGDEGLPYNFVAGCEGIPGYDGRHQVLENAFRQAWLAVCPDFQDTHGYPKNLPGEANLTMATSWVGQQFRCLSFTIEMPFKDNADLPNLLTGWNGERSRKLGASVLLPIHAVLNSLR